MISTSNPNISEVSQSLLSGRVAQGMTYFSDVVWPESKQIGIIDSIFRNFYIPPVIFAANSFEDGSETKTCIDGKQRLTSIHRCVKASSVLVLGSYWCGQVYGWFSECSFDCVMSRLTVPLQIPRTFIKLRLLVVSPSDIVVCNRQRPVSIIYKHQIAL